jgi:hypothetical protein
MEMRHIFKGHWIYLTWSDNRSHCQHPQRQKPHQLALQRGAARASRTLMKSEEDTDEA